MVEHAGLWADHATSRTKIHTADGILRLPVELIEDVASRLHHSGHHFFHLRLSCRHVSEQLRRLFKELFYRTRRISLTRHGLHSLLRLARHQDLAQAVREVTVSLPKLRLENRHLCWHTSCATPGLLPLQQGYQELIGLVPLLSEVLSRLESCESIRVGENLRSAQSDHRNVEASATSTFWLLLKAIAGTDWQALSKLENLEIQGQLHIHVLIFPDHVHGRLREALSRIKSLSITNLNCCCSPNAACPGRGRHCSDPEDGWWHAENSLFAAMANLERLALGDVEYCGRLQISVFEMFVKRVFLRLGWRGMRGLEVFGGYNQEPGMYAALVKHCVNLEYISFTRTTFNPACWEPLIATAAQHGSLSTIRIRWSQTKARSGPDQEGWGAKLPCEPKGVGGNVLVITPPDFKATGPHDWALQTNWTFPMVECQGYITWKEILFQKSSP